MVDLLQIIDNIRAILPSLDWLLQIFAYVTGLVFVWMAITGAAHRSRMGQASGSWSRPITTFAIGASLIALPSLVGVLSYTLFSATPTDPSAIFSYAPETVGMFDETAPARTMVTGIVAIVMFMGVAGIIRGLLLLKAAADGSAGRGASPIGPGVTFLVAGIIAVNFPRFVGLMEGLLVAGS